MVMGYAVQLENSNHLTEIEQKQAAAIVRQVVVDFMNMSIDNTFEIAWTTVPVFLTNN